jgi:hypothetical protein
MFCGIFFTLKKELTIKLHENHTKRGFRYHYVRLTQICPNGTQQAKPSAVGSTIGKKSNVRAHENFLTQSLPKCRGLNQRVISPIRLPVLSIVKPFLEEEK